MQTDSTRMSYRAQSTPHRPSGEMGPQPAYAHSLQGQPPERWERLHEHLSRVSELAGEYARAFGAEDWARLMGRWHDLGKYSDAFQSYLARAGGLDDAGENEDRPGRVDHSTFGAQFALQHLPPHAARIVAFCIAGHHAGLADAIGTGPVTDRSCLESRLVKLLEPVVPSPEIAQVGQPKLPFTPTPDEAGFQVAVFTRMLFSCLIDADRTATEAFTDPQRAAERGRKKPSLPALAEQLDSYLRGLEATAAPSVVNDARRNVSRCCKNASPQPPGFFELRVPTGGGKTIASLSFALDHAVRHGLRRVIVALPFTSVIEQNAEAYRKVLGPLGPDAVLEHHSSIEPARDTLHNQMAAENWDAPVIVTTNVQLYESLFASRTRPCRKLHRIAQSVIILDEAQTIPVDLLTPTLAALRELVAHYGCSIVLCTATQPALEKREGFAIGLEGVRPIVSEPASLFTALRRTRVKALGLLEDAVLSKRLSAERSALCIVNTRAHASGLYDQLLQNSVEAECFHLSTFMCAEHRSQQLALIRDRLNKRLACRVVSTQLVEAGVDLDFPVVYRAPAGFDSVAQAAGRCNREGRLEYGSLYLFDTEKSPPPGWLRQTVQVAKEVGHVLWPDGMAPDPIDPAAIEAYFRQLYWTQQHLWDKHDVMEAFAHGLADRTVLRLQFRDAASRYRLIRDDQVPILVPHGEAGKALLGRFVSSPDVDYSMLRAAQRFFVHVWPQTRAKLENVGALVEHPLSGMWLLVRPEFYTAGKGLDVARLEEDSGVVTV